MNHPGPLLTDLVDGTLSSADRVDVEAHLATCGSCRQEVALARAARRALGSMPPVVPPAGLVEAAIAGASAHPSPTRIGEAGSRRSARRWIGVAAAAAVIGLVAVAAPKLGTSPSPTVAEGAGAADRSFPRADAVEVVRTDVSSAQLAFVAASLGGVEPGGTAASLGGVGPGGTAAPSADVTGVESAASVPARQARRQLPERLSEASACLEQAWGAAPGPLTRVLLARFQGTPAYFGLYAVGPGAGLAPTRLQLLVASVEGCQALASAYVLL